MKIFILLALIIFDFLTKKIVFNYIELNSFISLAFFIDIVHIKNYGIAFGLFAKSLPSSIIIFSGILIVIFLIYLVLKNSNIKEKWGLLLIIAGAVSNILDRFLNDYVLDFIHLHYKNYSWPAFNFADIYISIGVLVIIIETYQKSKTSLQDKND